MAGELAGFGRDELLIEAVPFRSVRGRSKAGSRGRKGWGRLGVALGVPYFGVWWSLLGIGYRHFEAARLAVEGDLASVSTGELILRDQVLRGAQGQFEMAVFWGVVLPAVVAVGWVVARWVKRGFEG